MVRNAWTGPDLDFDFGFSDFCPWISSTVKSCSPIFKSLSNRFNHINQVMIHLPRRVMYFLTFSGVIFSLLFLFLALLDKFPFTSVFTIVLLICLFQISLLFGLYFCFLEKIMRCCMKFTSKSNGYSFTKRKIRIFFQKKLKMYEKQKKKETKAVLKRHSKDVFERFLKLNGFHERKECRTSLLVIPKEVVVDIFVNYLTVPFLVNTISLVCKKFKLIVDSDYTWRAKFLKNISKKKNGNYTKKEYIYHYKERKIIIKNSEKIRGVVYDFDEKKIRFNVRNIVSVPINYDWTRIFPEKTLNSVIYIYTNFKKNEYILNCNEICDSDVAFQILKRNKIRMKVEYDMFIFGEVKKTTIKIDLFSSVKEGNDYFNSLCMLSNFKRILNNCSSWSSSLFLTPKNNWIISKLFFDTYFSVYSPKSNIEKLLNFEIKMNEIEKLKECIKQIFFVFLQRKKAKYFLELFNYEMINILLKKIDTLGKNSSYVHRSSRSIMFYYVKRYLIQFTVIEKGVNIYEKYLQKCLNCLNKGIIIRSIDSVRDFTSYVDYFVMYEKMMNFLIEHIDFKIFKINIINDASFRKEMRNLQRKRMFTMGYDYKYISTIMRKIYGNSFKWNNDDSDDESIFVNVDDEIDYHHGYEE